MFSMSRNILGSQNLRQGAAILDFKMATICFTLLCISLPVAYGCHIGIQDGRHIIRHAVFHDRQMSLTLSVVTKKVVISPFRSDLTRFNKIAIQETSRMAVEKEAISLSRFLLILF